MSTSHEGDTLGAIADTDRNRRELAWLVREVGADAVRDALANLPGRTRPYPLNIARALGLVLPASLALPPAGSAVRAEVARRAAALRAAASASRPAT